MSYVYNVYMNTYITSVIKLIYLKCPVEIEKCKPSTFVKYLNVCMHKSIQNGSP